MNSEPEKAWTTDHIEGMIETIVLDLRGIVSWHLNNKSDDYNTMHALLTCSELLSDVEITTDVDNV